MLWKSHNASTVVVRSMKIETGYRSLGVFSRVVGKVLLKQQALPLLLEPRRFHHHQVHPRALPGGVPSHFILPG